MHLNAIRIKELILGKRHTEVAMCLGHLASLYTYKLRRFKEAENLFLRAEKICKLNKIKLYNVVKVINVTTKKLIILI